MPQGKAVTKAIQWIVIRLSAILSPVDIAAYTDISERKVRDILSYFDRNGDVKVPTHERARLQRSLRDEDIQVWKQIFITTILDVADLSWQHLFDTLSSTPDLYLDELQLELQETCGVSVSIPTVWRALVKGGYTMKKVRLYLALVCTWNLCSIAFLCCTWTQCWEASKFCCSHRHLWSKSTGLCRWECCWSPHNLSWKGLGNMWPQGQQKVLLLSGEKVSRTEN